MSTGSRRNVRTASFRDMYSQLPERIRALAILAFRQFLRDPSHPSLAVHELHPNRRGQHRPGSVSVAINRQYRAIYVPDGQDNVWYWIGSHSTYNTYTGRN